MHRYKSKGIGNASRERMIVHVHSSTRLLLRTVADPGNMEEGGGGGGGGGVHQWREVHLAARGCGGAL